MSENLFGKIRCRKICFGKFGVGKFASENLMSENLFRKIQCQKNFRIPFLAMYILAACIYLNKDRAPVMGNLKPQI